MDLSTIERLFLLWKKFAKHLRNTRTEHMQLLKVNNIASDDGK